MPRNEFGQSVGESVLNHNAPSLASLRDDMVGRLCRLVALDASLHASELHAAYRSAPDDRDWTYLPYGPFTSEDEFKAWIVSMQDLDDPIFFAVVDLATDKAVGVASYLRINPAAASIEVGHIHFSPLMQRTPMATEAMYLMMQRVFDGSWRRYEWKCDDLNGPSRVAARRFGFRFEGIFRQATMYKGRNRDTAWFGITDAEWPAFETEYQRWLDPANFDAGGRQRTPLRVRPGDALTTASTIMLAPSRKT